MDIGAQPRGFVALVGKVVVSVSGGFRFPRNQGRQDIQIRIEHEERRRHVAVEGSEVVVAAIEVDAGPAAGIDHAHPAGGGTAEGHADLPDRAELARGDDVRNLVGHIARFEPVMHEDAVRPPYVRANRGNALPVPHRLLVAGPGAPAALVERRADEAQPLVFRHLRCQPLHFRHERRVHARHIAIREHHGGGVVGVLHRVNDVAVAGQFFQQRRVLARKGRITVAVDDHRPVRRRIHERRVLVGIGGTVLEVLEEERHAHGAAQAGGGGFGLDCIEIGTGAPPRHIPRRVPDAHQQASRFVFASGQHALAGGIGEFEIPNPYRMLARRRRERGHHEDVKQPDRDCAKNGEQGTARIRHAQRFPAFAAFAQPHRSQQQQGDRHAAGRLPAMVHDRHDANHKRDQRCHGNDASARLKPGHPPSGNADRQSRTEYPVNQQHEVAPSSQRLSWPPATQTHDNQGILSKGSADQRGR